jgi:hypothetical protein
MSPYKEFPWVLPLVALHFHPSADLYRVSLERTFTGFTLSGFSFILNPQQFCPPKDPLFYFCVA